mgnify:CR=1 FL=1
MSVGVMTTTGHELRAKTFDAMNPIGKSAAIEPQTLYVGKKPDNESYIRRVVR